MDVGYGALMAARTLFGQRVRILRRQRGLSLEALATAADLNDKYLGAVELGKQAASLDTIQKIATGLGVAMHELFVRSDATDKELRARVNELLREAAGDDLRRVVAVLEAMLH